MKDSFYFNFENEHRGDRETIKRRLKIYLPFILPFHEGKTDKPPVALDLGCGRGEWIELLTEHGFVAQGIDSNEIMVNACKKLGLSAKKGDALNYLRKQKDKSFVLISGIHIAEHLPLEKLEELIKLAYRKLKAGGLLILETPNPENLIVGTCGFYLDPTHRRPLPPSLLDFMAKQEGYARTKVLRLQEAEGLKESDNLTLLNVLSSVSPDYSLVAQKKAPRKVLEKFDAPFSKNYGVSLNYIATRYEEQINDKTKNFQIELNHRISELENIFAVERQKTESLAAELNQAVEAKAQTENQVHALTNELTSTHQRVEDLSLRTEQTETEIAAERQKTDRLTAKLNEAAAEKERFASRAQSLEKELGTANGRVGELASRQEKMESELSAEREKNDRAQSEILKKTETALQVQAHNQSLRKDLDLESQRVQALRDQAGQLEDSLRAEREQRAGMEAQLNEIRQERDHLQAHSQWLQNEWDAAKQKVDELNHHSHHWWTVADQLNHDLQAVYVSNSWRLTWPLRKTADIIRGIRRGVVRFFLWIVALPKRVIRGLVVRAMAFVLKRNVLRLKTLSVVNRFPALKARLKALAQARSLIPDFERQSVYREFSEAQEPPMPGASESMPPPSSQTEVNSTGSSPSDVEMEHLSPRGKRIYFQLRKAMAKRGD